MTPGAFPTPGRAWPRPIASLLIGLVAQQTLGATAYACIGLSLYLEAGGHRSAHAGALTRLGVDPTDPGDIRAGAPYARIAYVKNLGDQNREAGAFGLRSDLHPAMNESAGPPDQYADAGLDASYKAFKRSKDVLTLNARYPFESQRPDASQALGLSSRRRDHLIDALFDASDYFSDKVGLTVGAFETLGSADALLYAVDRTLKPNTSGLNLQRDDTF